jgi:hypothetical protein
MKKTLNNLIWLAKQETPPSVDVADFVLASLHSGRAGTADDVYRAYTWISVASAAVAAGIVLVATMAWQQADSVSEMLTYISWVQL